ncbi:unnamed protein product [Mytilus coruscus]|uniref:Uncharacterized protein n=1 Tax=Mytilus coruscus TaxID=42192 RepID=A0A6J8C654_MYTCO|nr:unnamed protein product [Mytilus coruscus]
MKVSIRNNKTKSQISKIELNPNTTYISKESIQANLDDTNNTKVAVRSIADNAYIRRETSESFNKAHCGKILTLPDAEKARKLPMELFVFHFISTSTHKVKDNVPGVGYISKIFTFAENICNWGIVNRIHSNGFEDKADQVSIVTSTFLVRLHLESLSHTNPGHYMSLDKKSLFDENGLLRKDNRQPFNLRLICIGVDLHPGDVEGIELFSSQFSVQKH